MERGILVSDKAKTKPEKFLSPKGFDKNYNIKLIGMDWLTDEYKFWRHLLEDKRKEVQ